VTDSRPAKISSRSRFGTVVLRLTGVNILVPLLAFVTSPILARTLGPVGRGEIAAIFAVVSIAPWISELGLTAFLSREHARRSQPLGILLGTTMPIILAASLVGVTLAVPLAHVLGRGRPDVVFFIEVGLFLLPLGVFLQTLYGVAIGDQDWGLIMLVRVLSTGGTAGAIVVLSLLDALTVNTAAATYIVFGIVANAPFLVELRGSRPWRFVRPIASAGLAFGVRSWLSTLANVGNVQLDQLLMAGLVTSRQLGLYALAVTLATASGSLVGATSIALVPRVAAGESELAARACRVTLLAVVVSGIVMGSTSPVLVPFIFGRAFVGTIPMLVVLLGASVLSVTSQVLGPALIAGGNPSATARGQVAGLAVTVPALIVVLPFAGGLGAAWVSLAAYGVTFGIILRAAARTFALPYRTLLIVTREDLRWLSAQLRGRPGMKMWPWARMRQ
jgi:O-antigen/teichoic acid export membrane protein